MKTILIVIFIMLPIYSTVHAVDEMNFAEFKVSVNQFIKYRNSRSFPTPLNESLKANIKRFIYMNRDTPVTNFKVFRVLRPATGIMENELSRIYGKLQPNNYEQKITNKEDRELYTIILNIRRKDKIYKVSFCKGNEAEYSKSLARQRELWGQLSDVPRNSTEEIEILEKINAECSANDNALWSLLPALRWRAGTEQRYLEEYNKVMIKLIGEDQVSYDHSGSNDNAIDSTFKIEFFHFLSNANFKNGKLILTSDQVRLVTEAVLTKFPDVFSVQGLTGEGEEATDVFTIVSSMTELAVWLDYYRLYDLRKRYIDAFFRNDLVQQTLKGNSFKGSKEILDYLQQNPSVK